MAHTFEFEGVTVEYFPALVRTRIRRGRILNRLMASYGYVIENPQAGQVVISDDEWSDMLEYAEFLAQSKASGATWWADENASLTDLRAAYEAFLDSPADLFDKLRTARHAVTPPKKTS